MTLEQEQETQGRPNGGVRKTVYFDEVTWSILERYAKDEHRSESNFLQYLILQYEKNRKAKQAA